MFKIKLIVAAAILLLAGTGAAFAATGHMSEAVKALAGASQGPSHSMPQGEHGSVADSQYSRGGVSDVARDKSAMGTKTLPNGKEIENHGLAVSQAAKSQYGEQGNADHAPARERHGEEEGNQSSTQMHQGRGSGTASPQPPVSSPSQGGGHGRR